MIRFLKPISGLLVFCMLAAPMAAIAQGADDRAQGIADGKKDAEADVSKAMWVIVGCLTTGGSYIYPDLFAYNVPQSRLVGKSPEYVAAYTDSYLHTRKSIIHSGSCIGGLITIGACVAYYVIVIAILAESVSEVSSYDYYE